jgi:homoserine O-succinyltransferase
MPIKIPNDLPAARVLGEEGVPVIQEGDALRQDIRPMRILLLNLMPEKIKTETQLARLLGATPLQVELTLLRTASHISKNTPEHHLAKFYTQLADIEQQCFDGLIVTGAPVELLDFEQVTYWRELQDIFEWGASHVLRMFFICWGAQAALHHFFGVPKYPLPKKCFGIFPHRCLRPSARICLGYDDLFNVPVSRHTEVRREDVEKHEALELLAVSDEAGPCLVQDRGTGHLFMFNHLEYDSHTLHDEYRRDLSAGKAIEVPFNYFPRDDPTQEPRNTWRSHAHLLMANWLDILYQAAPYEVSNVHGVRPGAVPPSRR